MIAKLIFPLFECLLMWLLITTVVTDDVNFISVGVVKNRIKEDSIYADIINHCKNPTLEILDRITCAHETTHMINAELRNKLQKGRKINAFYLPKGNAFIIEEPDMTKARVGEFIPKELRWKRYDTYITQARAWNDRPLYLVDEWDAYVNGGMVAVDDSINHRHVQGWTDAVSGSLEFSVYCVAMCMAIEKYDNDYWEKNDQLRNFMKWNLQRSLHTYNAGKDYQYFKWEEQEKYLDRFLNSPSQGAENLRSFIREHFEGIWLNEK